MAHIQAALGLSENPKTGFSCFLSQDKRVGLDCSRSQSFTPALLLKRTEGWKCPVCVSRRSMVGLDQKELHPSQLCPALGLSESPNAAGICTHAMALPWLAVWQMH